MDFSLVAVSDETKTITTQNYNEYAPSAAVRIVYRLGVYIYIESVGNYNEKQIGRERERERAKETTRRRRRRVEIKPHP